MSLPPSKEILKILFHILNFNAVRKYEIIFFKHATTTKRKNHLIMIKEC